MHLFIYSSFVLTSVCGGWLLCYLRPLFDQLIELPGLGPNRAQQFLL